MGKWTWFHPIALLFVKNPGLFPADQQQVTFMGLMVQPVWMPGTVTHPGSPQSSAQRGVHPHGCTSPGLALSFLCWVARGHARPQSLLCWNIENKTCVFSLISAGANRLCLSDCKVLSGNRNLESAQRWRKTPQSKGKSDNPKCGEVCPPLSPGVSWVARLCN